MSPRFFTSPALFRKWLEANHALKDELWVGFHKKGTGKRSITWPESVDQALCFGWIDGIRKSIDEERYAIRFTPRRRRSIWSAVNTKRAIELSKQGLMSPAGLRAFGARTDQRSGVYSFEQRDTVKLPAEYQRILAKNGEALHFFSSQAPWYQRVASWWVISAKKEETRLKRLATLVADSAHHRRIGPVAGKKSEPPP